MQTSCSSKCRLLMVAFPIHWQLWGLLLTVSLSILVHLRWLQSVLQLLQDAQVEVMEGKQNVSTSEQTFAAASWYLLTRLWKSLCWSVTLFSTPCCTMSGRDLSLSLHTLTDFDQLWPTLPRSIMSWVTHVCFSFRIFKASSALRLCTSFRSTLENDECDTNVRQSFWLWAFVSWNSSISTSQVLRNPVFWTHPHQQATAFDTLLAAITHEWIVHDFYGAETVQNVQTCHQH